MNYRKTLFLLFLIPFSLTAQKAPKNSISRVDPAFWWTDMKNEQLELLVYNPAIGSSQVSLSYPGVELKKAEPAENSDYIYLTLQISPETKPGSFPITFANGKKKLIYNYELKERNRDKARVQGVNPSDFIYLLMPDRFANGDPSNDIVAGTQETSLNRDSMYYRHGGDLQGVIDHLDYFTELGITALWLNPMHENDQPRWSYHGYAITDHYKIDKRLGTNSLYADLVQKAHSKGLKVVMDIVPNHIGNRHWLFLNLPSKDWVNEWPAFTKTNYRAPLLMDPYASQAELKQFSDGWFDNHMPDLNQRNPHVARYLTQSYIWWVEYAGIDDFRIDTYAYSDQGYMADMASDLRREYPQMNMFAEIWEHGVGINSFFAEKFRSRGRFDSKLPGVLDFQVYTAINEALTKAPGWTEGTGRIYYTLAQDMLYEHPLTNVTFLDNHDLSRFYSVVGEDIRKYKMGVAFLLTVRGTPSVYYGTEILMKGFSNPDGWVRMDFKGGWASDSENKFIEKGRNVQENEAFNYMKKLATWRKTNKAVQDGKMLQFIPDKTLYVYFRYNGNETVMVCMNAGDKEINVDCSKYDEILKNRRTGKDVVDGSSTDLEKLTLKPWDIQVIEIN